MSIRFHKNDLPDLSRYDVEAVAIDTETLGLKPHLDPDRIVATAAQEAGSSDFGSDSYREPLELFIASLEAEAGLSTFGRLAIRKMLVAQLVNRIRLQTWTKSHPEAEREEIHRPWIILGLPRTGTSLLSMLLGLDPMARPLRQWEGAAIAPPSTLATANEDPRIAEATKRTRRRTMGVHGAGFGAVLQF